MKYNAANYQTQATNFIIENNKVALILDMGLGKTVITLTAINELIFNHYEITRVLVVAPLRVADITWQEEIEKWSHLQFLRLSKILGKEKKRIAALEEDAEVYTINRENLAWLIKYHLKTKKPWKFNMVVLDESSSFKNPNSVRFRAAKKLAPKTSRIVELTGTPTPNGLIDLWSQVYILDEGKRLGRTLTSYRDKYFVPGKRSGNIIYNYLPKKEAKEEIYAKLKDIMISMSAKDYLKLPPITYNEIKVQMDSEEQLLYNKLEEEMLLNINEQTIEAVNVAVLANKLLQLANGAAYTTEAKEYVEIHARKLEALDEIMDLYEDHNIMVVWAFKHDYERIKKRFKKYKPQSIETVEDYKKWKEGKIKMLLAHPASLGHGLNLQTGGSIVVWYGLTYNLEWYLQTIARLYRQGQKEKVIVHHIVTKGTRDEDAIKRLKKKEINQLELVESLKARIKEVKERYKL